MNPSSSPLVQRRRLRAELRQARQNADLTQDAVAEKMDWSLSKVIRIETGAVGISTNDLQALLRIYGIKDAGKVRELVALGREARRQTWWTNRQSMPAAYFQYIEYETAASVIRSYETMIVPGLLQTHSMPPPWRRAAERYSAPERSGLLSRSERSARSFFFIRKNLQGFSLCSTKPRSTAWRPSGR